MTNDLDREFNLMADCVEMIEKARDMGLHLGHDPAGPEPDKSITWEAQHRDGSWHAFAPSILSGPPQYISFNCAGEPKVYVDRVLQSDIVVRSQHYQPCQWDHLHLQPRLPRERKTLWQRFVLWIRNNVLFRIRIGD